jgi:hypothetical protein
MAIIYTYPTAIPTGSDNLIGTQVDPITEENKTVQFSISNINSLASSNFIETTLTVTNAQLTALQTTDVTLIAAPGTNKTIKVLEVSVFLDYTAPAFTFANDILVSLNAVTFGTIPVAIGQAAADTIYSAIPVAGILATNTALLLTTAGAVGGGGGSAMQVKVRYQILDISTTSSF